MKKALWFLTGLFVRCFMSFAGVVTPERSAAVAADVFSRTGVSTKAADASSIRLAASFPVSDAALGSQSPALYVYERTNGGYVVIAGDDAALPVLAYAATGAFPTDAKMPPNMKALIQWYARVIGLARSRGWEAAASVRALWANPASAVPSSSPVTLTTATWDQGRPFNDLCPKVDGQECPCGCVATAIGIIMRYHKWPEKGTGTLPAYEYGWYDETGDHFYRVDGVTLGQPYEWDKMPMDYSGSYSQEAGSQVARLMRDIGVMSEMQYDPTGSGASGDSPIQLATYFGYDKQMRYLNRSNYSDDRWEALIRDEIDAGRPVFHCGYTSDGGHAFVMDGYNDRYFRINYGWSGAGNAFYTMTPVEGHQEDLTEFNRWQEMVTHIMPDRGGSPYVDLRLGESMSSFGWDFRSDSFLSGETGLHRYKSTGDGPTELCYCLYDRDGHFREALCAPFVVVSNGEWLLQVPSVRCKAPAQAADGDCIMLSRQDDHGQWEPLPQQRQNYLQFDGRHSLPEIVSIGHTYGWATQWVVGEDPNLLVRSYKDIYWELRGKDGALLLTSAEIGVNNVYREVGDIVVQAYYEYLRSDGYDRPCFEFFLPQGEYTFLFRNFQEEMTIRVKL